MTQSIAATYTILLKDWNYRTIAVFDAFSDLSFTREVNNIGSFSFGLSALDDRVDLFLLDCFVVILRSVPGCGIAPYPEFVGFHRKPSFTVSKSGDQKFVSTGVGLNYLLQGVCINYQEGTVRSYKNCSANRAMYEYVDENCGELAHVSAERMSDAELPMFEIADVVDAGPTWEGDRAYQNLLDVIRDIAKFSSIDFNIDYEDDRESLVFRTYPSGIGTNRTTAGLASSSGFNSYGNRPLVFAPELGNVSSLNYDYDRISEGNVCTVLGEGDGATRYIQVRSKSTKFDSPFNRREITRPYSGFESEMQVAGDEALRDSRAKESVSIDPLMTDSSLYGVHYTLGDIVTVRFRGVDRHRRITSVTVNVGQSETIRLNLEEI